MVRASEETKRLVLDMWDRGLPMADVVSRSGLSESTVYRLLREAGREARRPGWRTK